MTGRPVVPLSSKLCRQVAHRHQVAPHWPGLTSPIGLPGPVAQERPLVTDLDSLARERPLVADLDSLAWKRSLVANLDNLAWKCPLVAHLVNLAPERPLLADLGNWA